jgi:hypothetical protein
MPRLRLLAMVKPSFYIRLNHTTAQRAIVWLAGGGFSGLKQNFLAIFCSIYWIYRNHHHHLFVLPSGGDKLLPSQPHRFQTDNDDHVVIIVNNSLSVAKSNGDRRFRTNCDDIFAVVIGFDYHRSSQGRQDWIVHGSGHR